MSSKIAMTRCEIVPRSVADKFAWMRALMRIPVEGRPAPRSSPTIFPSRSSVCDRWPIRSPQG